MANYSYNLLLISALRLVKVVFAFIIMDRGVMSQSGLR